MNYTRIKAPKFKIGRCVLNEYELRQLQVEIAKGLKKGNIKVLDKTNNQVYTLDDKGSWDFAPNGYTYSYRATVELIKHRRCASKK